MVRNGDLAHDVKFNEVCGLDRCYSVLAFELLLVVMKAGTVSVFSKESSAWVLQPSKDAFVPKPDLLEVFFKPHAVIVLVALLG